MSQYDYAVYRDRQNHTCIVLKDTGKSVEFIAMGNEFLVGKMDGKEFHAEYKAMPEYPVKRAAEQYLAFAALTAGLTGKAREHLDGIVADPTLEYDRTQFNPVPKPSKEKHIMAAAKKTAAPAKAAGKKESLVTRAAKPGKAAVENESGGSPIPKVSKYAGIVISRSTRSMHEDQTCILCGSSRRMRFVNARVKMLAPLVCGVGVWMA